MVFEALQRNVKILNLKSIACGMQHELDAKGWLSYLGMASWRIVQTGSHDLFKINYVYERIPHWS